MPNIEFNIPNFDNSAIQPTSNFTDPPISPTPATIPHIFPCGYCLQYLLKSVLYMGKHIT